eukprot:4064766-Prymnesium_polylepis.1
MAKNLPTSFFSMLGTTSVKRPLDACVMSKSSTNVTHAIMTEQECARQPGPEERIVPTPVARLGVGRILDCEEPRLTPAAM